MAEGVNTRCPGNRVPVQPFEADIARADPHALQQMGCPADIRVDGHVVVVEDDDHRLSAGGSRGQAFIGKPAGQRPVSENAGNIIMLAAQGPRLCHPHRDRDRVGSMAGDEGVVIGLTRFGEPGDAAVLTQRAETIPAAGDDLVDIALMPDIENDAVNRRVIDAVKGQGQLHGAQVGRQMSAGLGNRLDKEDAHFIRKGFQFLLRQRLDIR